MRPTEYWLEAYEDKKTLNLRPSLPKIRSGIPLIPDLGEEAGFQPFFFFKPGSFYLPPRERGRILPDIRSANSHRSFLI